jgi:hypothetical protein
MIGSKRAHGYLIDHELMPEAAKKRAPLCYRCASAMIRTASPVGEVSEVSDPHTALRQPLPLRTRAF